MDRGDAVEGCLGPLAGQPPRRAASARRTSSFDVEWRHGRDGPMTLTGRARDLATAADGATTVLADVALVAVVARGIVTALHAGTGGAALARLVGEPVRRARRVLAEAAPDLTVDGSALGLLVDELPVVALVSGAARLRQRPAVAPGAGRPPLDVCAGWATAAAAPPAPPSTDRWRPATSEPHVDERDWHPTGDLPPGSMRRRRRLDLARHPGSAGFDGALEIDAFDVDAWYRDSYVEADGGESVVHEYGVTARVDGHLRVVAIDVAPRVLPKVNCHTAAGSAQRLLGRPLAEIRSLVRADFVGPTTCTHLNDTLRSIGDLHRLATALTPLDPTPRTATG